MLALFLNIAGGGGFLSGSDSKESACSAGDPGSTSGSGRSPGEGMATHSISLLGESHGQTMMGYGPWGRKKSDTTEHLLLFFSFLSQ